MAYLGFSKGGAKPGGLGDGSPPAGSGAEPQRPATFGDSEGNFEQVLLSGIIIIHHMRCKRAKRKNVTNNTMIEYACSCSILFWTVLFTETARDDFFPELIYNGIIVKCFITIYIKMSKPIETCVAHYGP